MLKRLFMMILLLAALAGCANTTGLYQVPVNGLQEEPSMAEVQLLFSNSNYQSTTPEEQRFDAYQNQYMWKNSFTGGIGMMGVLHF